MNRRDSLLAVQCVLLGAWIAGEVWRWRLKPVQVSNYVSHCHITAKPDSDGPLLAFGSPK